MSPQEIVDAINEGYSNKIDQEVFIEWKEIEDKMYRGEDIFPLMIED